MKIENIYLIFILAGITRFSETVYLPSLPFITKEFEIEPFEAEFTSSAFLAGVSIGNSFWGIISDFFGKRKSIFFGMLIYILASLGCGFANKVSYLTWFKFLQGISCGSGIIIAQIMSREIKGENQKAKIFSIMFSGLAIIPAAGPIIGNIVTKYLNWRFNFFIMILVATSGLVLNYLSIEVKQIKEKLNFRVILSIILRMIKDKKLLYISMIIGSCSGISFCYYTEGGFYMTELLLWDKDIYSYSYIIIAAAAFFGGKISKILSDKFSSTELISFGSIISILSNLFFLVCALLYKNSLIDIKIFPYLIIFAMSVFTFSVGLIVPNCMSIALNNYYNALGLTTSFFGFMYYMIASLVSLGIVILRSDDVIIMPFYFFILSLLCFGIQKKIN